MFIELYFIKAQFSDKRHCTDVQAIQTIHIQFLHKMKAVGCGTRRCMCVCAGVCVCMGVFACVCLSVCAQSKAFARERERERARVLSFCCSASERPLLHFEKWSVCACKLRRNGEKDGTDLGETGGRG